MNEDLMALAKLRFEELLSFFEVNGNVKLEEDGNSLRMNVEVADSGRLIGHRGENLRALQHLLNNMVRNRTQERVFITIDISGYRQARADSLTARALADADKVAETGEELHLRPMNPADRRIIHMALADHAAVITESAGEEPRRRVVIKKRA